MVQYEYLEPYSTSWIRFGVSEELGSLLTVDLEYHAMKYDVKGFWTKLV